MTFTDYANTEAIDAVNFSGNIPKRIGDFRIKYIATDGWRGYYEAVPTKKSGWAKLEDGWVTGNWDDAPPDSQSSNVEEKHAKLYDRVHSLGGEMVVMFVPTSNVFSTAYDVFIRGITKEQL